MLTDHALEELEADSLHLLDLESAILTGEIVRTQTVKPEAPEPVHTVVGQATDLETQMAVICRFIVEMRLLIITVYECTNE